MKSFLFIVFNLLLSSSLFGQLLWKISGSNFKETSYLYGTIHAVPKDKFVVSPILSSAFESCDALALEIDLNMSLKEQIGMAQQIILPKGKSLKNYITSEDYNRFQRYCMDSLGMKKSKIKKYIKLKPFFITSIILQEQLGSIEGYDQYFNKEAKNRKIPSSGLETLEYQLTMVNTISIEEQADMLIESLGSEMIEYNKMLDLYLANDLNGLSEMINNAEMSTASFMENFLTQRNKNWIPVIEKLISSQKTFIAVGAGHLPGEFGVIELLRKKGFQVEAVN
jgi:uncharacterized protein YbaP (TraB family)